MTLLSINNYFFVVSLIILDVSLIILEESEAIGAIVESFATAVVSVVVSVLEVSPPQAASKADVHTITSNFFILI
jgi:hypothetical protein